MLAILKNLQQLAIYCYLVTYFKAKNFWVIKFSKATEENVF